MKCASVWMMPSAVFASIHSLRVPQERYLVHCQTVCGWESTSPYVCGRGVWCVFSYTYFYMNQKCLEACARNS